MILISVNSMAKIRENDVTLLCYRSNSGDMVRWVLLEEGNKSLKKCRLWILKGIALLTNIEVGFSVRSSKLSD